jgi:hypothetical protein
MSAICSGVVEIPPKIGSEAPKPLPMTGSEPAKEVPLVVVEPEPGGGPHRSAFAGGPPVHALSALTLVAVDSLWAVFDWAPPLWIAAIPFCFLAVFVPVFLIQKNLKGDSTARALTFATLFGVLAAIPLPIAGTPVGLGLLAWTGLGKLVGKSPPS